MLPFVTDKKIEQLNKFERFVQNAEVGMTKDQYLALMEQLGQEPKEEEIPPDVTDFPYCAQQAFEVYAKLADRHIVTPSSILYVGKDLSTFKMLCDLYEVDKDEQALVLDFVTIIDKYAIKKANRKRPKK